MTRILVIAHLNHDRIWQLDGSLISGSRISWTGRETKPGGGGYFTGSRFLELGHDVALVSSLGNDAAGSEAGEYFSRLGFDMQYVVRRDTPTAITEILLEPSGERTILTEQGSPMRLFTIHQEATADAAYINCFNPDATILRTLDAIPFVASQFPLSEASVARPADLVIGSRGDFPDVNDAELWDRASGICGVRLKHLVMTDGARPITIHDGTEIRTVSPMKRTSVRGTIGAGDHFSASLISAMMRGMPVEDAAAMASKETADWLELRGRQQQDAG